MTTAWRADFAAPEALAPLRAAAAPLVSADDWPALETYDALAAARGARNAAGDPIRFVAAAPKKPRRRKSRRRGPVPYETQVYDAAEVPTRPRHWHDLFNMLAWCTYPQTKAALNARQVLARLESADPDVRRGVRRSAEHDRLTMLDEGGIVLAVTPEARQTLDAWLGLSQRKPAKPQPRTLPAQARAFLIGHAVMELIQAGNWDVTAMAFVVDVDREFFGLDMTAQVAAVDRAAAGAIMARCMADAGSFPGFPVASLRD
jgi:hypothetical protein